MQPLSPLIKSNQPNPTHTSYTNPPPKKKRREREIDVSIEKMQESKATKPDGRSQNDENTPAPHTRLPTSCSRTKENQDGELEQHQLHSTKRSDHKRTNQC